MQVRKRDTGRIYALKTISKAHIVDRNEITHTLAERAVLSRVDCPFIVPLKFSFQSHQKLYLVLAYVRYILPTVFSQANGSLALSMAESSSITSSKSSVSARTARASMPQSSF
jgi:serine/threonine protein kinase